MTDAKIFETLTEREAGIKAEVDQYSERLWKDAREIIHDRLPSKVLYLNRIIQVRWSECAQFWDDRRLPTVMGIDQISRLPWLPLLRRPFPPTHSFAIGEQDLPLH